jgi:hypothetical protein
MQKEKWKIKVGWREGTKGRGGGKKSQRKEKKRKEISGINS